MGQETHVDVQTVRSDSRPVPIKIYRVSDHTRLVDGEPASANNVLYFLDRDLALEEGARLARIYEAMHDVVMERHRVNQFGILTVWQDRVPDPNHEVRVEEGVIQDA